MTMTTTSTTRFDANAWRGIYKLADPKITLASVASMILGACAAAAHGAISWTWLLLTVAGIFFIEAAKNASGEIFDWDSGTDQAIQADERTPFSGGKRVIVDGLLSRQQTAAIAAAFYGLGGIAGFSIVILREPLVLWLGFAGAALAFFYHAPPFKLAYRGLGELAVAVSYGPIIAAGTYLVQRGTIGRDVLLMSVPLGTAIMAFLWINELPDRRADELAGKRTLVVRLGRAGASRGFMAIVVMAQAMILALPALGLPWTTLLGLVSLPLGLAAAHRVNRFGAPKSELTIADIVPAQGWTLLSFVAMAIGLGVGILLG